MAARTPQKLISEVLGLSGALLDRAYSVKDFGAKGDGVHDDTTAVQAAFDALPTEGGVITFPDGAYLLTNKITCAKSNVVVDGQNASIHFANTVNNLNNPAIRQNWVGIFNFSGAATGVSQRVSSISTPSFGNFERSTYLVVPDASGFAAKDWVQVSTPVVSSTANDYKPGIDVLCQVYAVDLGTNTLTLAYRTAFDMTWCDCGTNVVTVTKINAVRNITVQNIRIYDDMPYTNLNAGADAAERTIVAAGIAFEYAANVTVRNVWATGTKFPLVITHYCNTVIVANVHLEAAAYLGPSEGYAVHFRNSSNLRAMNVTGGRLRHLVDFTTSSWGIVDHCVSHGKDSAAFKLHGRNEHNVSYFDCTGLFQLGDQAATTEATGLAKDVYLCRCNGSLTIGDCEDLVIENSTLAQEDVCYSPSITWRRSRLVVSRFTLFQCRKRGRTMRSFVHMIDSQLVFETPYATSLQVSNGFDGIDEVRLRGCYVNYSGSWALLRFNEIPDLMMRDCTIVDTQVMPANTVARSINHVYDRCVFLTGANTCPGATYDTIIQTYRLTNATGRVDVTRCVFKNSYVGRVYYPVRCDTVKAPAYSGSALVVSIVGCYIANEGGSGMAMTDSAGALCVLKKRDNTLVGVTANNNTDFDSWVPDVFSAAAPAAGAWKVGQKVWNSAPAAGSPLGWVCTAAGSPGTWKAMANLV